MTSACSRAKALLCATLFAGAATAQTVDVIEYYNASRDHYFISSLQADITALDSGKFAGWKRTGSTFKAYSKPTANASPVCRFYIPPAQGDSHFYSASPAECAQTASKFPAFVAESSNVMYVNLPDAATGACPSGDVPVYRVWDNRADSNHRYTTDINLRNYMVGQGWVAEGYGPAAVIMCAPQPSRLLFKAWSPDGTEMNFSDFFLYNRFVTSPNWMAILNYGVYPIGQPPATPSIGSLATPVFVDGTSYIALDVPSDQPLYLTMLWKAPVIGTVHMRADNGGAGYAVSAHGNRKLELPYDFALSEYQMAQRLLPGGSLSPEAQGLLTQATAAVDAARNATSPAARALASYSALSFVMPLKERLVIDASNKATAVTGRRTDFDLNYEGFGSWTGSQQVPGYLVAKDAGFKSVYTIVFWNQVSPTPGVYDFSMLDYQIDEARKLGFQVALQINWSFAMLPTWAQSLAFDDLKALYYRNAQAVVSRYGTKVSTYYAAGEMELGSEHKITFEQAAELARQSLNGARAAAPATPFGIYVSASAYVAIQMNVVPDPTYYSGLDLLKYLKSQNINFDFVALQMQYGTVFPAIDLQRFQEVLQDYYSVLKVPIYMGETGYSSRTENYGMPGDTYWRNGLTEQTQYEWADGTLRILYAMPFVKAYYWVHLDPDNNNYGKEEVTAFVGTNFVRADGTVKKVASAFKNFDVALGKLGAAAKSSTGDPVAVGAPSAPQASPGASP